MNPRRIKLLKGRKEGKKAKKEERKEERKGRRKRERKGGKKLANTKKNIGKCKYFNITSTEIF